MSSDAIPSSSGLNGFASADGGVPAVDCPGRCDASPGAALYAEASQGYVFAGWYANGAMVSTNNTFTVASSTPSAITAKFSVE